MPATPHDNDTGLGITLDSQANVIVTGVSPGATGSYDIYTVKYAAANGDPLWEQRYDGAAQQYLTVALSARYWLDEIHLDASSGEAVFNAAQQAISVLCGGRVKGRPGTVGNEYAVAIARILKAERLLASVSILEADQSGAPRNRLERARRFLAKGDREVTKETCGGGSDDYLNAWSTATRFAWGNHE